MSSIYRDRTRNHKKSCDKFPYGFKGTPPARQA